nr:LysR substrate-binding domain-containing protein [Acinetobacter sp. Marseille-Q1620]
MAKRNLPPLNALRMFEAVARNNSFSLAADELYVTHSAVSHQIKQLEAWMGKKLLNRHSHGASLTSDGQQLFTTCIQLFNTLENCVDKIKKQSESMMLTIGAPSSFMANWLIPRLEKFEEKYPEVSIKLMTCNDLKMLEKNQVDCLIMNHTQQETIPKNITSIPLLEDRIGPVCTSNRAKELQQPQDVLKHHLLHTQSNQNAWAMWTKQYGLNIENAKHQRHFDHLNLMIEAAASGLGIAIAPEILVEKELLNQRLVAPFGFIHCGSFFSLLIKNDDLNHHSIKTLVQWFIHEIQPQT